MAYVRRYMQKRKRGKVLIREHIRKEPYGVGKIATSRLHSQPTHERSVANTETRNDLSNKCYWYVSRKTVRKLLKKNDPNYKPIRKLARKNKLKNWRMNERRLLDLYKAK